MGGLRVVGGVAARACVETKRKTHSSNGAATDLEASGTGREVSNPPSDRDSILIIDLAGIPNIPATSGAAAVPCAFLRQPLR